MKECNIHERSKRAHNVNPLKFKVVSINDIQSGRGIV